MRLGELLRYESLSALADSLDNKRVAVWNALPLK